MLKSSHFSLTPFWFVTVNTDFTLLKSTTLHKLNHVGHFNRYKVGTLCIFMQEVPIVRAGTYLPNNHHYSQGWQHWTAGYGSGIMADPSLDKMAARQGNSNLINIYKSSLIRDKNLKILIGGVCTFTKVNVMFYFVIGKDWIFVFPVINKSIIYQCGILVEDVDICGRKFSFYLMGGKWLSM